MTKNIRRREELPPLYGPLKKIGSSGGIIIPVDITKHYELEIGDWLEIRIIKIPSRKSQSRRDGA